MGLGLILFLYIIKCYVGWCGVCFGVNHWRKSWVFCPISAVPTNLYWIADCAPTSPSPQLFPWYECNDRTFHMVVLVGYSDAGRRIVVVVRSGRMSLSGQPRVVASSRHDSGAAKRWHVGRQAGCLGCSRERYCWYIVMLWITGVVNCFLSVTLVCTILWN